MKITRTGLAVLLIAGMAQASEEFEVKAYSPSKGTVEISCGGEITGRPFSSFSAAEQQQITGWLADKEFQSSSGLSIETEKNEVRQPLDKMGKGSRVEGKIAEVSYTITLENRAEAALENIEVAYQIFYKQCEYSTSETKQNMRRTGTDRITLAPGSTRTLETVTVSIRDGRMIPITQETTISTPFGSSSFVTGPPTTYLRDRLGGLYLCVSRKDAGGKSIEREYTVGDVPKKEDWETYQQQKYAPNAVTQGEKPHVELHSLNETWSEEEIQIRTETAERSSTGAVFLGEYYRIHGDMQKAKQWADRAREMLEKLTPVLREKTAKRIEALDKAIKDSQTVISHEPPISGSKTPSSVTQGKKPRTKLRSLNETWSEEEIQSRTETAERSSGTAVYLGEYYLVHGDMQKAKQWADKARELLEKLPSELREKTAKRIEALDQAVKAARADND